MILFIPYGNYSLLKSVTVEYNDATHAIVNGVVGEIDIPSGLGEGIEFYRQEGVGEYWSLRVLNSAPYATVTHVVITLAEDLAITGVAVVDQIGVTLGSATVTATGTGTKRYKLGESAVQVSNVFNNLYAGVYLLTVSRTEDDYTVTQNVTIGEAPSLEVTAVKTDCTANGIDDGTITLTVLNGSGDYDADFVTEVVVVPLTNASPSTTRVALAPNTYVIEVTDNVTLQIVTLNLTIIYPVAVVEPVTGTIFEVPFINSISFVIDNDQDQQADNVLFADQVHLGKEKACYFQKLNLTDTPKVQFRSNFLTHAMKLYKYSDDTEVKQFPIVLAEENVGGTIDYAITIKDYVNPNQSKVYFQAGNIPIPLAVGNNFEVSNNADGFDGVYQILDILVESSTGLPIMIINLDYTAGGASSSATGTFDNQLADFNVFESVVVVDDVAAGIYYLKIIVSNPSDREAISEPIQIKADHLGTLAIVYSNTDNDFGMVYNTGYRGFLRVPASMFKRVPGGERTTNRNSNDSLVKIRARKRRIIEFETELLPPYMHEKLSVVFDNDFFSVNGVAHQASEGYNEPAYEEWARLSMSSIRLEQLNWFGTFKSNKDMPSETEACTCDTIDLLSVSTSAATITLNLANKIQRIFKLAGTISGAKAIALSNDTLGLAIKIFFTIDNLAAVFTFPAAFKMKTSDPRWDNGAKTFTPVTTGAYEGEAVFDGTNWNLTLNV